MNQTVLNVLVFISLALYFLRCSKQSWFTNWSSSRHLLKTQLSGSDVRHGRHAIINPIDISTISSRVFKSIITIVFTIATEFRFLSFFKAELQLHLLRQGRGPLVTMSKQTTSVTAVTTPRLTFPNNTDLVQNSVGDIADNTIVVQLELFPSISDLIGAMLK